MLVNQAAVSAVLAVVLQSPDAVFSPDRFIGALIGGGVALAINYLFPVNPERLVERAAAPVFDELVAVLEEIARVLREGDEERAERVLDRSRGIDSRVRTLNEALAAGHETARLSPTRRRSLRQLEFYSSAGIRIELAVISTRCPCPRRPQRLRRGTGQHSAATSRGRPRPLAVREGLAAFLEDDEGPKEARRWALEAARSATEIPEERHELGISVLVGQVRSAAVDLLRSTGMDQASALRAPEDAAGRASEIG